MRMFTLAMTAVITLGFAATASAAKKKPITVGSFEQCEQLAIERGVPHGQAGHTDFVRQCMGKRPLGRQAL